MVALKGCPTWARLRRVIAAVARAGSPEGAGPKTSDSELSPGVAGVVAVTAKLADAPGASVFDAGATAWGHVTQDCERSEQRPGPRARVATRWRRRAGRCRTAP